jgi:transcription elongation factor Elf1
MNNKRKTKKMNQINKMPTDLKKKFTRVIYKTKKMISSKCSIGSGTDQILAHCAGTMK